MSLDAMDIDSVPPSPERKRKNKEKDGHSAKKRKHESKTTTQPEVEETSQKAKKKKKKEKEKEKEKERKHKEDLEPSVEALTDTPNSLSKKTKKHKHQTQEPVNEDQDRDQPFSQSQPSTTSRKPLTKASASQLKLASADSSESSPFHLITATLYVPLSPISISPTHALSSLQAEHLSPLLLTYYPPFRGVVLAYSNASISSAPPSLSSSATNHNPDEDPNPQPLTLALSAGEYGVLFVYLTAKFLVFRPERGQPLEGWINVQSDGFLGAVVYNLFSVGIERRRLPADWQWVAPGQEPTASMLEAPIAKTSGNGNDSGNDDDEEEEEEEESEFDSDKENFRPLPAVSTAMLDLSTQNQNDDGTDQPFETFEDASEGYFRTRSGRRVRGMARFRVREIDVIPGAEPDKAFLSIEGTMLCPEEEAKLVEEERKRAGFAPSLSSSAAGRSGNEAPDRAMMSGGLGMASAAAVEREEEIEADVPMSEKQGKEKKKKKKKGKKAAS
ncbi:hypothetical protein ACJ72_08028 [Emergomyces africanus]|uniref:DNA-directed RNA polymerase subunit n=1 Tax=Emergomyces africanus TaxID=1955775 RepID=A0A1B7NLF5_9EURO|nr:hypothetical protein ACJ72_08028 [Emergomyces africanus]